MRSWHPLSKLTVVVGLGALALVWWLDGGTPREAGSAAASAPPPATSAVAPATRLQTAPVPPRPGEDHADLRTLPPVDAFASMVDRPLFAPARRPLEQAVDVAALEVPLWTVEPAAAPAYPSVSFVGSIEENGRLRALLGNGYAVRGVAVGEEVEGWTVLAIEARRLTLGHGSAVVELAIFE